jgi:hypothetical protein
MLFRDHVQHLAMSRHTYVERAANVADYCRLFGETFGPLIAIRASLHGEPERQTQLDHEFREAVVRWNHGRSTGPVEIPYEYLLVIARRASGGRNNRDHAI